MIVAFTLDEVKRLLEVAKKYSFRNYCLFLVTFSHGLRISETISLTADNFRDCYLVVSRLKGSKKTIQPLIVSSKNPLLDERSAIARLLTCTPAGRLFPMSRQFADTLIKKYGAEAQIPAHKLHCHALKHTVGTIMIKSSPIHLVQGWLGHKSLASTGHYLDAGMDECADAFTQALGR